MDFWNINKYEYVCVINLSVKYNLLQIPSSPLQ